MNVFAYHGFSTRQEQPAGNDCTRMTRMGVTSLPVRIEYTAISLFLFQKHQASTNIVNHLLEPVSLSGRSPMAHDMKRNPYVFIK